MGTHSDFKSAARVRFHVDLSMIMHAPVLLRPLESSVDFFNHCTAPAHILYTRAKSVSGISEKQTCCPRRNNAKLPGLAILTEILTVNQDDLAGASLLASSFPSTFESDVTQAISTTKHSILC